MANKRRKSAEPDGPGLQSSDRVPAPDARDEDDFIEDEYREGSVYEESPRSKRSAKTAAKRTSDEKHVRTNV
jgi:hypothetical protein